MDDVQVVPPVVLLEVGAAVAEHASASAREMMLELVLMLMSVWIVVCESVAGPRKISPW